MWRWRDALPLTIQLYLELSMRVTLKVDLRT
jgi:hypothetical protein